MSGLFHALKRALKETYKEETVNVNLTEIEEMKIADSTGTVIDPATEGTLSGIKTQTDKLDFDDKNRVAVYDKFRNHVGGRITASYGSYATATIDGITVNKRVAIAIRVQDSGTGHEAFATAVSCSFRSNQTVGNAPYMEAKFAYKVYFYYNMPTNKIKIHLYNYHNPRTLAADYLVTWW